MKKRKKHFASLYGRMILLFVPVIVIALTVTGWFCYRRTQQIIRQNQLNLAGSLLEKAALDVDSALKNAIQTTEQIIYFPTVYQVMLGAKGKELGTEMKDYRETILFLYTLEQQSGYVRVRIFAEGIGDMLLQDQVRLFPYDQLENQIPINGQIQNRTDQVRIVETYQDTENTANYEKNSWIISVVRFVVNGPERYVTAAVSVDMDSESLLTKWTFQSNEDQTLFLANRDGRILSCSEPGQIGTQISKDRISEIYRNDFWQDGEKYYLSRQLENTDWFLFMELSDSYVLEDTESILSLMLLMIVAACLVGILAVMFLSRMLTDRLRMVVGTIEHSILQPTLSDLLGQSIPEEKGEYEETAVLIRAYNRMLERISVLSTENAEMAVRESRYRMEALRRQINSHFLYNALASIKGYIEMNDASAASSLLMELASFFRHSMDRAGAFVSLQEELEIVRAYLRIQQLVYEDLFTYQICVPPQLLNIRVPKFILQPIVENAVIHGVLERGEDGRILVSAQELDDAVLVRIEDNGVGFGKKMLETQTEGLGIGMQNVATRLKLYFGSHAGLRLTNLEDGGGCVEIKIPVGGDQKEVGIYDQDSVGG